MPGGTVTSTMGTGAEREGAFRFLESRSVDTDAVAVAVFEAAAVACRDSSFVYVALDQTDLNYVDRKGIRGLGPHYARKNPLVRGAQVMNALALDEAGVPLGVLDQTWWLRPEEAIQLPKRDPRPPEERESWKWIESTDACLARINKDAPGTKPWFVMDRGADFHGVLVRAVEQDLLLTLRTSYERKIKLHGRVQSLWPTLARRRAIGYIDIQIPRRSDRTARTARFEVRALESEVRIRRHPCPQVWAKLGAVRIREVSPVPSGEARIEWRLLTTHRLQSLKDVELVVRSYTYRWRIEEFHKTWKSGACDVESSQLRSFDAIRRWATILAAVAVRVERLKKLSREQPDIDALTEFTQEEIDSAIILTETKDLQPGAKLSLKDAVRLVAMVGGYMGRNRDGPPGSITIRRGLERVAPAAAVLRAQRSG